MFNHYETTTTCVFKETAWSLPSETELLLPPVNCGEVILLKSGGLTIRQYGKARSFQVSNDQVVFLLPRDKGLSLQTTEGADILIWQVNPLNMPEIVSALPEVIGGVYMLNCQKGQSTAWCALEWMEEKIRRTQETEMDLVKFCLEKIRESKGMVAISQLYEEYGVSKSTLVQHFSKRIGLTPKNFCRIEKLNHFLKMRQKNPKLSLTELCYECGYYDQSHLIKDFRYFVSMSPRRYLAHIDWSRKAAISR